VPEPVDDPIAEPIPEPQGVAEAVTAAEPTAPMKKQGLPLWVVLLVLLICLAVVYVIFDHLTETKSISLPVHPPPKRQPGHR